MKENFCIIGGFSIELGNNEDYKATGQKWNKWLEGQALIISVVVYLSLYYFLYLFIIMLIKNIKSSYKFSKKISHYCFNSQVK